MALKNRSVATIDNPEFINLQEDAICPGVSKCEIKIFYLGKNRNGSFIDKNIAIQMSNSLRCTPIVGCYRKDIEDFGDHGEVIHIENGKVEFKCSTVPFGFVAPDADVWFQKFTDTDEFGNDIEREYMMTTGYLWTGQYPECAKAIQEGQPQSMEIKDVDGHWANDSKSGMDFFIINDAVFSKLCILGDDVEPCFEGASVTGADKQFSNGESFTRTLFTMMNELKYALENKGGSYMPNEVQASEETLFEANEEVEETSVENAPVAEVEETTEEFAVEEPEEGNDTAEEEFAKDDKKEEDEKPSDDKKDDSDDDSKGDDSEDDNNSEDDDPEDDDKKKKPSGKNSLEEVQTQLSELQTQYSALLEEVEQLREFKAEREDADKQAIIDKYHMLSDEDKADVIANKRQFTCGEIEAKLALIYVQKNVDFDSVDGKIEVDAPAPITTFSLDEDISTEEAGEDLFLNALRDTIR